MVTMEMSGYQVKHGCILLCIKPPPPHTHTHRHTHSGRCLVVYPVYVFTIYTADLTGVGLV